MATFTAGSPASAADTTGTIGGTITDNGTPVAGAQVTVQSDDGSFWDSVETDSAGHYEVLNVPAATSAYRVEVYVPGHPTQYAHGKTEWWEADLFSVTAGQQTTVDETLLPTGTITGRFTDPAGNGVSAWVNAYDDERALQASGHTADDGSFSLVALPGTYRVSFNFGSVYQYAYGTYDYDQATLFPLAAGETVTVNDVRLPVGAIDGHVTNADGTPAADIEVEAYGTYGSERVMTDTSGAYRIDSLPTGSYKLRYQLPSGTVQWAHQARTQDEAQSFTVSGDAVTTVDEQLLPTGTIAGRFTDSSGAPLDEIFVYAFQDGQDSSAWTSTDSNGNYRLDGLTVGTYQVSFENWDRTVYQYAYGKLSRAEADPITVTAGQTTTVNDSQLPTGSIRFTATDSVTGAAINNFHVYVNNQWKGTTDGVIILSDLPASTYSVEAGAEGYVYTEHAATVTVVAGEQVEVALELEPVGRITTTVTDAATGAPVANMCVFIVKPKQFAFPDGCPERSDETGAVTLETPGAGTYHLFVLPDRDSPYGAQWVGRYGGTGTQTAARPVTVAAGQTVTVPEIKLDGRGTITGKVTSVTGQPVQHGTVGIVGPDTGLGADQRYAPVAADGTYTIDWLGPYRWPLLFHADDHAFQWSGGVGNRLYARLVQVKPHKVTRYNYLLRQGTEVTVVIPDEPGNGRVVVHNAASGDPMGVIDGTDLPTTGVELRVIGPQRVKIMCYCWSGNIWHGGTDFASATTVPIPAIGTTRITFTRE